MTFNYMSTTNRIKIYWRFFKKIVGNTNDINFN